MAVCSVLSLCILLALLCGMLGHGAGQGSEGYVVRYLSTKGADSSLCLLDQSLALNATPCKSLVYALSGEYAMNATAFNVAVMVFPGVYDFGEFGIELEYSENVTILKVPGETEEVVIQCAAFLENTYNNFYIYRSKNVELSGITFMSCGRFSPAVRFQTSDNILIRDCTFRDNVNSGLVLYQVNNFSINNTMFQDNNSSLLGENSETNRFRPGNFRFAGGISVFTTDVTSFSGSISNCMFIRNKALVKSQVEDNLTRLYTPVGDGGAMAITLNNTHFTTLNFESVKFMDNLADDYGGGISLTLTGGSQNNSIIFQDAEFRNNVAVKAAGGAISMNVFEKSNVNTLVMQDIIFDANSAFIGGGAVSISLQDNLVSDDVDVLSNVGVFSSVTFTGNCAQSGGSAVRLISNARIDQVMATTNFTDCLFSNNGPSTTSGGAILSFRSPVGVSGTTVFRGNVGGAVSLLRSRLDASGTVLFEGNTAVQGGAIAMQDLSQINLLKDVNLTFINNYASVRGGAVSAITATVGVGTDIILYFNLRCFFIYDASNAPPSMLPELWPASVSFINNTAESDGAAIYTSDITRCTYTNGSATTNSDEDIFGSEDYVRSIFPPSNVFHYSNNRVLNPRVYRGLENLATAPSQLVITPQVVTAAPGETVPFRVGAVDQAGNWQSAVWSLSDKEVGNSALEINFEDLFSVTPEGTTHEYIVSNFDTVEYSGLEKTLNFSLIEVIRGGVANTTQVKLTLTDCYPGYEFDNKTKKCEFVGENDRILRPDIQSRYVYLKRRIYAEVRDGRLVTALMPTTFQNCTPEGNSSIVELRGCQFKFDAVDEQCSDKRTGFLCGKCPNGTAIDLTLRTCRKCSIRDAIIVAVIVIVFVVAALLVLILNIGVPNDLKSCFFFVQVVGFVYTSAASSRWDYHLSRIFGFNLYLPLCPYPGYDALSTATYGFMLSSFAIAIVVVYVISARFIRALSDRTAFNGFWLLSIVIYKYIADTCFSILQCVKVSGGAEVEYAYYYNGSIKCFQSDRHLGLAVFALFLIVFVVLLFPVIILVISFKRYKLTHAFTDVLTNGLKVSCRWWSAFDLFRRLLFIIVAFIFAYINTSFLQLALLFAGLAVLLVFAITQPYISTRANVIEMVVLLDLVVLTALFLNDRDHASQQQFAMFLLLLPFLITAVFICAELVERLWRRLSPGTMKALYKKLMTKKLKIGNQHPKQRKAHTLEATNSIEFSTIEEEEGEETHANTQYSEYREELLDT